MPVPDYTVLEDQSTPIVEEGRPLCPSRPLQATPGRHASNAGCPASPAFPKTRMVPAEHDCARFEQSLGTVVSGLRWLSDAVTQLESEWQDISGQGSGVGLRAPEIDAPRAPFISNGVEAYPSTHIAPKKIPSVVFATPEPWSPPSSPVACPQRREDLGSTLSSAGSSPDRSSTVTTVGSRTPKRTSSIRQKTISQLWNLRSAWSELEESIVQNYEERFHEWSEIHASAQRDDPKKGSRTFGAVYVPTDSSFEYRWVLHPSGQPRIVWNVICLFFIVYDIIMVPMGAFDLPDYVSIVVIDWMCTIIWTLDIPISLRTAYFHQSALVARPRRIAIHYAKTWMTLDFLIVGSEWATRIFSTALPSGRFLRTSRVLRILRCVRLLRVAKLQVIWQIVEDQLNSSVLHLIFSLLKLTIGLLVITHCLACGWYAVGAGTENGWVTYYGVKDWGDYAVFAWYSASSRWTLAQINGRTDMDDRRNLYELAYTCFVAVGFAVIFMSIFISSITATMMELNTLAESKTSARRLVNTYLHGHSVSSELIGCVKNHLTLMDSESREGQDEECRVIALLSPQLAQDLLYEVRASVLTVHHWFMGINREFPRTVRQICHATATVLWPHQDEVVFDRGDACNRMLFAEGGVMIYVPSYEINADNQNSAPTVDAGSPEGDGHVLQRTVSNLDDRFNSLEVERGDWLSEAALWVEWMNRGRLFAGDKGALLVLGVSEFSKTLREYRGPYAMAVLYARQYVVELQKQEELSDLPFARLSPPSDSVGA